MSNGNVPRTNRSLQQLEEEAQMINDSNLSVVSRQIYFSQINKYFQWLVATQSELLTRDFTEALARNRAPAPPRTRKRANPEPPLLSREFLQDYLSHAPDNPPLFFDRLQIRRDFEIFLCTLTLDGEEKPSKSVYDSARSALKHLFSLYGTHLGPDREVELKIFYRGLKRTIAERKASGEGRLEEGKSPLEFSLYKLVCLRLLQLGDFFTHTYLTLTWNLACRAGNTASVKFNHIGWDEDALIIRFAHMKNDKEGINSKDPRHVYANPVIPEISFLLSLGLYFLEYGIEKDAKDLFPGAKQKSRFEKSLKRLWKDEFISAELGRRGVCPKQFGTHSPRKGCASLLSSGSTASPSGISVQLRVGWKLEGVQGRYIRFERAGDQYVGRVAAGLPPEHPEFALLPPFFVGLENSMLSETIRTLWPNSPKNLERVLEFCLASVVFHRDFIRANLPENSSIFLTPIFQDRCLMETLSQKVVCRHAIPSDQLRATGIPPHISLLMQVQSVAPALESLKPAIRSDLERILEERSVAAGAVTRHGLEQLLSDVLDKAGVPEIIQSLRSPFSLNETRNRPMPTSESQSRTPYFWKGKFRLVPETFSFPCGNLVTSFTAWLVGDTLHGYPPLRLLSSQDMPNSNLARRRSEFAFVMTTLEQRLIDANKWIENPSIAQASLMAEEAVSLMNLPEKTPKGRHRRTHQLTWISVIKMMKAPATSGT